MDISGVRVPCYIEPPPLTLGSCSPQDSVFSFAQLVLESARSQYYAIAYARNLRLHPFNGSLRSLNPFRSETFFCSVPGHIWVTNVSS